MFETTVGTLNPTQLSPPAEENKMTVSMKVMKGQKREKVVDDSEDLASEEGMDDEYEDMGELSDSPSSLPSFSRPVTPHADSPSDPIIRRSRSPPSSSDEPFSLSHKAASLLGLQPGTLPHARASLENARDEVRRTAEVSSDSELPAFEGPSKSRMARARKVMSVVGVVGHSRTPSVVVGYGNEEEMKRRERRRKAADGVLYWQKEVERLEAEEKRLQGTTKRRR